MLHRLKLMAPLVGALALGACAASGSPEWDARFGDSARALAAQQTLDPSASRGNGQANPRIDGRTTREAMERQIESYRTPPPSNVINIGVGGGGR